MPRAPFPDASLIASADALVLPWLAPRACVETSVLRLRSRSTRKTVHTGHVRTTRAVDERSSFSSARLTRVSPLGLRYADIARHVRGYATAPASSTTSDTPHTSTSNHADGIPRVTDSTRYSRRRSWKDALAKETVELTPEKAGRRRLKHIAVAEARLQRHVERLQRDRRRFEYKLLYDGQYRSLRRFILGLKRWDETTEDLRKDRGIDPDDEHWILRAFAALDRSTYARVSALTKPVTLQHDGRCHRFTAKLLHDVKGNSDDQERIWFNWQNFGENKKFFDSMLVYMLENKPGHAHDFITVLAADPSLPDSKFVILADALAHLARLHLRGDYPADQGWEASPDANTRKFIATFVLCTRSIDTAVYSQDLLHSLVLLADTADLKKIYDVLMETKTRLSVGTTLHFASAFGEAGEFYYALQCLERRLAAFKDPERIVDSERFRWACATILRGSMRDANNYHETPGIVAAFVKYGVKLDLLLYDVVMHNAMDAGDFATAFKVYNALDANGLVPDKYTFSILLHGCTKQDDPSMFKAFADWCIVKAKELNDPWLATDCLYYIYVCEQSKDITARDTNLIWRTYLDLFDMTPLDEFRRDGSRSMKDAIDQHHSSVPGNSATQKLPPTPMALYLMLQTEIQTTQTLGIHYLELLYRRFKHALLNPRPNLAVLSQDPTIWNAFLHAFCAKAQYASASQVIKDMTAHHTPPNIYTWNIFLQSFFKTRQIAAAERVYALMRARGIDPDSYTYGIMARGYAKAQLVDRIGDTMRHVPDDAQMAPDLLRALGEVQARADLTAALEKARLEKERSVAEAAAKIKKEEEKRFEEPRFKSMLQSALRFRPAKHWDNGDAADEFLEPDDEPVGELKTQTQTQEQEQEQEQTQTQKQDPASPQTHTLKFASLLGTRSSGLGASPLPAFSAARKAEEGGRE